MGVSTDRTHHQSADWQTHWIWSFRPPRNADDVGPPPAPPRAATIYVRGLGAVSAELTPAARCFDAEGSLSAANAASTASRREAT